MHFSAMYRLRWYRRAFTRYGASNKCGVGKTSYFPAKCVNITRQMALTAAAWISITLNKSLTCLQLVLASNWSNFWHAFASRGLSVTAGISCQNFKLHTSKYFRSKRAISRLDNQKNFRNLCTPSQPHGAFVLAVLAVQTAKPATR